MLTMKHKVIIREDDYDAEQQAVWEKTVRVIRWEHDYEKRIYVIDYEDVILK